MPVQVELVSISAVREKAVLRQLTDLCATAGSLTIQEFSGGGLESIFGIAVHRDYWSHRS